MVCPKCDQQFIKFGAFLNHLQARHGMGGNLVNAGHVPREGVLPGSSQLRTFVCTACNRHFVYPGNFAKHMEKEHTTGSVVAEHASSPEEAENASSLGEAVNPTKSPVAKRKLSKDNDSTNDSNNNSTDNGKKTKTDIFGPEGDMSYADRDAGVDGE
jgi:uncharacterized C2H2 Zn-finger protein